jgi:hypothetical protein
MRFLVLVVALSLSGQALAQDELRGQCGAIDAAALEINETANKAAAWVTMLPDDIEQMIAFGRSAEALEAIRAVFSNSTVFVAADANKMIELFSAIVEAAPALERVRAASEGFDTTC